MDAAVAAIVGAGLGASATFGVSFVTTRSQARHEAASWRRDRKQTAYSSAIRALLRVHNRRSTMSAKGEPLVAKEDLGTFLDDLVDAQHWIAMLLIACEDPQRRSLEDARGSLDGLVDEMLYAPPTGARLRSVPDQLNEILSTVVTTARNDTES